MKFNWSNLCVGKQGENEPDVHGPFKAETRNMSQKCVQATFVQKLYSIIHLINLYPVDSAIGFPNTYPLDSDLTSA